MCNEWNSKLSEWDFRLLVIKINYRFSKDATEGWVEQVIVFEKIINSLSLTWPELLSIYNVIGFQIAVLNEMSALFKMLFYL